MAPLPPLPANNTARVFWDYSDGINEHTLMVRYAPSAGVDEASDRMHNFLVALAPTLYQITHRGFRAAASGSDISVPATWNGDTSYGTGTMPAVQAPRQLCFLARSSGGRRVRWFMWGFEGNTPDTYRFLSGANEALDAARLAIVAGQANGVFLSVDGANPVTYPYVNINYNSYYETQARP